MKNSDKKRIKKNAFIHIKKNFLNKHKVKKINQILNQLI